MQILPAKIKAKLVGYIKIDMIDIFIRNSILKSIEESIRFYPHSEGVKRNTKIQIRHYDVPGTIDKVCYEIQISDTHLLQVINTLDWCKTIIEQHGYVDGETDLMAVVSEHSDELQRMVNNSRNAMELIYQMRLKGHYSDDKYYKADN